MEPLPTKPGVYTITHRPTGRFYVGSTVNLQHRVNTHKSNLNRSAHGNRNLQAVHTTNTDLEVKIVVTESIELARDIEQELLDKFRGDSNCCNIGTGARALWGNGMPEEFKERLTVRCTGNSYGKGHVVTEEMRDAVRRANTGLKRSEETLAKMREAKKSTKRPVSVNGVRYEGVRDVSNALDIPYDTVRSRMLSTSETYAEWKFI